MSDRLEERRERHAQRHKLYRIGFGGARRRSLAG